MFSTAAHWVSQKCGHGGTFVIAAAIIIVWAATGPIFNYSDTWQLLINTGTTIVTFLMVFLIQNTQNRDTAAIQLKLDELIRSSNADNALMAVEDKAEAELRSMKGAANANSPQ